MIELVALAREARQARQSAATADRLAEMFKPLEPQI